MDPPRRKQNLTLFGSAALVLGLVLLMSQALAGGASGTPLQLVVSPTPDENGKFTICHVAGLASDPANFVTLTIAESAVFGPGGHFNENGTTQAGHEEDSFGECPEVATATNTATGIPGGGETPTNAPTATTEVATNTPTATTEVATNTPTATTEVATSTPTATEEAATSTPTATTEVATSTPTATEEAETSTPTATEEAATSTPTATGEALLAETPVTVLTVETGVQGGADIEGVAGVQQQPAQPQAGVAGAARLPSTGSGADDGRSDALLIAGLALAILGGALISARFLARA
jgi:hypothetical protein